MPSNHLILCCPLLLPPSIFPSIRVFSNESALPISFNISPSNEYSGLISFSIVWFDVLTVQGTLQSLPQHHNSKSSILWHSAFLMVQLSHPYMTTGKTIALIRWAFVNKVLSLLFNMLSSFAKLSFYISCLGFGFLNASELTPLVTSEKFSTVIPFRLCLCLLIPLFPSPV